MGINNMEMPGVPKEPGSGSEELLQEQEIVDLPFDLDLLQHVRPHRSESAVDETLEVLRGRDECHIRIIGEARLEGQRARAKELMAL